MDWTGVSHSVAPPLPISPSLGFLGASSCQIEASGPPFPGQFSGMCGRRGPGVRPARTPHVVHPSPGPCLPPPTPASVVFLADPSDPDLWGQEGQCTFLWKAQVQEEALVCLAGLCRSQAQGAPGPGVRASMCLRNCSGPAYGLQHHVWSTVTLSPS